MAHIDWIKQRAWRFGKAETSPSAWYYCMPWVLVAAAAVVLLIYLTAILSAVVTFLYRHMIEAPFEWLVVRRR